MDPFTEAQRRAARNRSPLLEEMYGEGASDFMGGRMAPGVIRDSPDRFMGPRMPSLESTPGESVRMQVPTQGGYSTPRLDQEVKAAEVAATKPNGLYGSSGKTLTGTSGANYYDPRTDVITLGPGFQQSDVGQANAERLANRRKAATGFATVPTMDELVQGLRAPGSLGPTREDKLQGASMYSQLLENASKQQGIADESEYRRGLLDTQRAQESRLLLKQDFEMTQGALNEIDKDPKMTPAQKELAKRQLMEQPWFVQAMQRQETARPVPAFGSASGGGSPALASPGAGTPKGGKASTKNTLPASILGIGVNAKNATGFLDELSKLPPEMTQDNSGGIRELLTSQYGPDVLGSEQTASPLTVAARSIPLALGGFIPGGANWYTPQGRQALYDRLWTPIDTLRGNPQAMRRLQTIRRLQELAR